MNPSISTEAGPNKKRKLPDSVEGGNKKMSELKLPENMQIHYITSFENCDKVLRKVIELSKGKWSVWGFDIEWKAFSKSGPGPVALMQLCRGDIILLLQLSSIPNARDSPAFIEFFESSHIYKVGLNISGDMKKIEKDFPNLKMRTRGACDLRNICQHLNAQLKVPKSLASMVEHLFHNELPKDFSIRCGNWEHLPLSDEQIKYAALDAYASYSCFQSIFENSKVNFNITTSEVTAVNSGETDTENIIPVSFNEIPLDKRFKFIMDTMEAMVIQPISETVDADATNGVFVNDCQYVLSPSRPQLTATIQSMRNRQGSSAGFNSPTLLSESVQSSFGASTLTPKRPKQSTEGAMSTPIFSDLPVLEPLNDAIIKHLDDHEGYVSPIPNKKSKCSQLKTKDFDDWNGGMAIDTIAQTRSVRPDTIFANILAVISDTGASYTFNKFQIPTESRNLIVQAILATIRINLRKSSLPTVCDDCVKSVNLSVCPHCLDGVGKRGVLDVNLKQVYAVLEYFLSPSEDKYYPDWKHLKIMFVHLKRILGENWTVSLLKMSVENPPHATIDSKNKDEESAYQFLAS